MTNGDNNAPRVRYAPSRRRLLRDATFVSLGIVAAACAPGATTTTASKKGGEFHATWPMDLPPKGVWNYYGGTPILGGSYLIELVYQNLAIYRWADKKWAYLLAESHTASPTEITVKLRKGVKWDDGKDVTAKDAFATFKLSRLTGSSIWNFVDDIDTPDDSTIHFKLKKTSALLERNILRTGIRAALDDDFDAAFAARAALDGLGHLRGLDAARVIDNQQRLHVLKRFAGSCR